MNQLPKEYIVDLRVGDRSKFKKWIDTTYSKNYNCSMNYYKVPVINYSEFELDNNRDFMERHHPGLPIIPLLEWEKLMENSKYTIDYVKNNRIAINCIKQEQWDKLVNLRLLEPRSHDKWENYETKTCIVISKGQYSPVAYWKGNDYEIIDFNQVNFEEDMKDKKIVGYKVPYDIYKGTNYQYSKGTIVKIVPNNTALAKQENNDSVIYFLPSEIVETWEPVYEDIKERIFVEGSEGSNAYEFNFKSDGCSINNINYTYNEVVEIGKLMKRGQIKELKVGCLRQFTLNEDFINKLIKRIEQENG